MAKRIVETETVTIKIRCSDSEAPKIVAALMGQYRGDVQLTHQTVNSRSFELHDGRQTVHLHPQTRALMHREN